MPAFRSPASVAPSNRIQGPRSSRQCDGVWNAQCVDVMRCVLSMKREANATKIDAVLAAAAERPIVEVSTSDLWWGARPVADHYEGRNAPGGLWTELRQQLRDSDPAARSGAGTERIRIGCLRWRLPTMKQGGSVHHERSLSGW